MSLTFSNPLLLYTYLAYRTTMSSWNYEAPNLAKNFMTKSVQVYFNKHPLNSGTGLVVVFMNTHIYDPVVVLEF